MWTPKNKTVQSPIPLLYFYFIEKFNPKNIKADTADPFVNKLFKKLRNKKKKMDKILTVESKVKSKEIILNEETKEMLA
jgi:hypothetical protein